jgi:WD40 repeat protein/Flp pilus assembly protein TadD
MGIVYRARHIGLNRIVALKMMRQGPLEGLDTEARFRREAEAVARLQHPNIVQIFEIGDSASGPFLSFEYAEHGSLAKYIKGSPQPVRTSAQLVEILARAIHFAHQHGIVHRDLKPANILLQKSEVRGGKSDDNGSQMPSSDFCPLTSDLCPKITDFGLAKWLDRDTASTQSGTILGTPSYMAPEQVCSPGGDPTPFMVGSVEKGAGPASDIYSLGAILYELLTGRPPFHAETPVETVVQVVHEEPVPPRRLRLKLARDLETICLKCLQKEPHKRYPSALALAEDLRRFLDGKPIQARPIGPQERMVKWARRRPAIAGLLALVALLAASGFAGITWQWQRAEKHGHDLDISLAEETRARQAEGIERERAELALYFHRIALAYREWWANNPIHAEQLLEECPRELRYWEWHYVNRLCHAELLCIHGQDGGPETSDFRHVAFSPDGRLLACAEGKWASGSPGEVTIWEAATGRRLFTCPCPEGPVFGVAFSPDGKRLASAATNWAKDSGGVRIWNTTTGTEILQVPNVGNVFDVAYSPDGRLLATAGWGGRVTLWDAKSGKQHRFLGQHAANVFSVAFSPDGSLVASGSWDRTARIWETETGKQRFTLHGSVDIRSIAYSPDGRHFAAACYDQTVKLWDLETKKARFVFRGHSGPTSCVTFSPDGRLVASGDSEGVIQIWKASDGKVILTLHAHAASVGGLAFSPDGLRLASSSFDKTIKIWDVTGQPEARTIGNNFGWSSSMAFTPDGHWLAMPGGLGRSEATKEVRLWDVEPGGLPVVLGDHQDKVTCVALRSDGRQLASGSLDRTIKLWDLQTRKLEQTLGPDNGKIQSLSLSPDGRLLAASSDEGNVTVWEPANAKEVHRLEGHRGTVKSVAFHPDGGELASAGEDGIVRIWDAIAGTKIKTFESSYPDGDQLRPINCMVYSPDGNTLAWGGADHHIRLWFRGLSEVGPQYGRGPVLKGHTAPVTGLAFTPDSQRIASTSLDTTVKIWDPSSGREILSLRGHINPPNAVAFSKDGSRLASVCSIIKIWETDKIKSSVAARLTDHPELIRAWHREQAQACEQENQWFGVHYHLDRWLKLDPQSLEICTRRGYATAAQGQWDRAVSEYTRALELGAAGWQFAYPMALASLMVDNSEYCRSCARLLGQAGSPENPNDANNLAWAFALAPLPLVDLTQPLQWSEKTVAGRPKDPVYLNTLGALYYRAGQFEDAILRLKEAIQAHGQGGTALDWLFLSMAYHRQKQPAEARKWLDQAVQWIEKQNAAEVEDSTSTPWTTQVELKLLRKEAELLQEKN